MAWPLHYRFSFGGSRGGDGSEQWQCNLRLAAREPDVLDPLANIRYTIISEYLPALSSWFRSSEMQISEQCSLNWVKCSLLDPAGRYVPGQHEVFVFSPEQVTHGGVGDTGHNPFQVALKLTFKSRDRVSGPGSRGGIYVPAPVMEVSSTTGLFQETYAIAAAARSAQLLNDLYRNALGEAALYPSIVSRIGAGAVSVVDAVGCDTRPDVLRSRAASLHPPKHYSETDYGLYP